MVQSKTELFDKVLSDTAFLFKALAHPARLMILQFLSATNTCISGDISDEIPLGRTTVNQHLKELKEAGLVEWHSKGTKTYYCLNTQKITDLKMILLRFIEGLNPEDYNCEL